LGVQSIVTFRDEEYEADWVTRKRTVTIDADGNFMKTQNVDMLIEKLIKKYGELEVTIRLAQISNLALDMLLEFNHADEITWYRFQELGFLTGSIYKPLSKLVKLGFLIRRGNGGSLDIFRWRLNMNVI
jgi:hypothetical protein